MANLQVNDEVAAMIASMSRVDTDYSRGAAAATVGGGSSRSSTGRRRGTTITGADGTVYYVKNEN